MRLGVAAACLGAVLALAPAGNAATVPMFATYKGIVSYSLSNIPAFGVGTDLLVGRSATIEFRYDVPPLSPPLGPGEFPGDEGGRFAFDEDGESGEALLAPQASARLTIEELDLVWDIWSWGFFLSGTGTPVDDDPRPPEEIEPWTHGIIHLVESWNDWGQSESLRGEVNWASDGPFIPLDQPFDTAMLAPGSWRSFADFDLNLCWDEDCDDYDYFYVTLDVDRVRVEVIPLPLSLPLLGTGLLALAAIARRRRLAA